MANSEIEPQAPVGPAALPAAALYRRCDPERLGFETTADVEPLEDMPGQARAVEALRFGLGIRRKGYNLFAIGPEGTGKRTVIDRLTRQRAESESTPPDQVYVNNFAEPHRPHALALPPGRGADLRRDMRALVEELREALPAAFESDDYRSRRQAIDNAFRERQEAAFRQVEQHGKARNIGLVRTPVGIGLAPLRDGDVLPPAEFNKLPPEEQERMQHEMTAIHDELQAVLQQMPKWEGERRDKLRELNGEVTRFAIGFRLDALNRGYADLPAVLEYLAVVGQDLVDNAEAFLLSRAAGPDIAAEASPRRAAVERGHFDRYQVNLIVDHQANGGAPVIEEDHPTLQNLIGRVEYRSEFGTLVTDFTLIKPGALHRANGGYLILDVRRVLMQPFAWEELKRTLRAGEIQIRSMADLMGIASAMTLQPRAIPLDVKIVLTGDRTLYYLLAELDPDFREQFKVAADFDDETPRDADSEMAYARLIAGIGRREYLRPLDRAAVARVIEHSARLADDSERITARIEAIADLMREADHLAGENGGRTIGAADIERAIAFQIRRASRLRERLQEEIRRGTFLIDSRGLRVGQVNGLSVLQLGGFAFGRPSRISARIRLGKGEVVDIEREVELGGPIHSKGVLILGGFLGGRYGRDRPLAVSASLVFEQSYGGVDGDSASMAELCAILSALAGLPIRQGIAITGSISQNGDAQAIGGVNEKIEGFYDVCLAAGLDGTQGVIIPKANVKHLMLRADVVAAAAEGKFSVYAVGGVDEAITILTGVAAGERDTSGSYPADTVNARVEATLATMVEQARRFAAPERKEGTP